MTEFVGEDHGERGFVGQHIKQATADHDGVPDGERFQRRGEQYTATDIALQIDVIGDHQVVDHGQEDLIHVAGRRQQTDLLQALNRVIFSLALPHALGDHGRRVGAPHRSDLSPQKRPAENPPESG